MFIISILVILVIAVAYLVVFPLRKRRPVMIKNSELAGFLFIISIIITFLGHKILASLIALFLSFFFIFKKRWFVYGITSGQIVEALQKAVTATRTVSAKLNNKYNIDDNNAKIKLSHWSEKTSLISFSFAHKSKKALLAIEVFRKFILNYFLE